MDSRTHECSKNSVDLEAVYSHVEKTASNSKDVHDLEFVLLCPDEFDKARDDYRIPSPEAFEGDTKNPKQYLNCCKFPSTSGETLSSMSATNCEHNVENVFDSNATATLPFRDKVQIPTKCSETENITSNVCETSKPVLSTGEDEPLLGNLNQLDHSEQLHHDNCTQETSSRESLKGSDEENHHEKVEMKSPGSPLKYEISVPDYALDGTQNRFIHVTLLNNLEGGTCSMNESILGDSHILTIPKLHSCLWMGCETHFLSVSDLSNHVTSSHIRPTKDQVFHCMWKDCVREGKGFNARYKMLSHIRTHTGEKPHVCIVENCDKSFARLENLKIHMRTHTGEKPYKCPHEGCTKSYANSSDRFKHTKTHYDKKPFHCKSPGCDKSYTDPSSLRKHSKTHLK